MAHASRPWRWSTTGTTYLQPADHVISTMPVRHLIQRAGPARAAETSSRRPTRLKYRDFLTVALIIDQADRVSGQLDLRP